MLLLLPPDSRGDEGRVNPFLYLPDELIVLAGVVTTDLTSGEIHRRLVAEGLTSQFEVGVDPTTPVLTISVEGTDPKDVIATREVIVTSVQDELRQLQSQEKSPRAQIVHARVYATEDIPNQISGDYMRGVIAVLGAGGLLTLLVAFAVDGLSRRRQRRAAAAKVESTSSQTPPSTDPEPAGDDLPEPLPIHAAQAQGHTRESTPRRVGSGGRRSGS